MSKVVSRRLKDWLATFLEYTEGLPTSLLFRRWTGISILTGALERKVWVHTFEMDLYPNLYVLLVSPPGVGKTVVTAKAQIFWGELDDHHMAPSSMSRASLMDAVREAERRLIMPERTPSIVNFNSLMIAINELSTLIPAYDNDFMGTLTDIYDGKRYGEKKRGRDLNYTLMSPQINLLAGTTPSYLNNIMPEGAWDQGFISRVILVYSGESPMKDLFAAEESKVKEYQDLIHDLKIIGTLFGKMGWEEEAAEAMSEWYRKRNPPIPDHPKLTHYNTRRTSHCLKLCMIASASRGDDLMITLEDYQTALGWLLDAEHEMPDIFKSMTQGGDSRAIEDCWHYCYEVYIKEKKNVPETRLWNFLVQRVPSHNIERVIKAMTSTGLLEKQIDGYKPMARR